MSGECRILVYGKYVRPGVYPVHSRFQRYVNYLQQDGTGSRVLGVTASVHEGAPAALVVDSLVPFAADRLVVTEDAVTAGGYRMPFSGAVLYDPAVDFSGADRDAFTCWLGAVRAELERSAAPGGPGCLAVPRLRAEFQGAFARALLGRYDAAAARLAEGDWAGCGELLRGVGGGLTPAGDDFCAGLLYALWVDGALTGRNRQKVRRQLYEKCAGGSIFSHTFLQSAYAGEPYAALRDLLRALRSGPVAAAAVRRVLELGHSSGTDLLCGLVCGLDRLETVYNM